MPHLKAYDKEGNILAIGYDVKNDQGSVIIPNLSPHTHYPQGEFFVSWEGDNYESEKTVVPEFTTLESSYKEITFYAKDILTVKPKTAYDIAVDNGFTGTEEEWVKSIKGEKGDSGLNLTQGGSAYEYAIEHGFVGNEEEWLASLKGDKGDKGEVGKNAYQLYVENFGFKGSLKDYLDSLKGDKGEKGEQGVPGVKGNTGDKGDTGKGAYVYAKENGFTGTEKEWLESLKGVKGDRGEKGEPFKYSDFTSEQLLQLKGEKGDKGEVKISDLTPEQRVLLKGEKGDRGDKVNYLSINGLYDVFVSQPISDTDYFVTRYYKDTVDEFMKGYDTYVNSSAMSVNEREIKEDYTSIIKGNLTTLEGNDNPYTTEIGTTLQYKFTGYSISFTSNTTTSGGLWKVVIDGEFIKNISTYSDNPAIITTLITDKLTQGEHTLLLEFLGQDPEHPVSNPRGWVRTGKYNNYYNTFTVKSQSVSRVDKKLFDVFADFSNKEYAISVKDLDKGDTANFFPMHSGIQTSFLGANTVRELIVDGKHVSLESKIDKLYFNEAKLIQKVYHKLPGDTNTRMESTFIVTFKDSKVYNYIRFNWLLDSQITSGYVFQMPFKSEWLDYIIVDDEEKILKRTDTSSSEFKKKDASIYRGLSKDNVGKDYVYQLTVEKTPLEMYKLWVQHRSDNLQKLYPQYYNMTERKKGSIDVFKGIYEIQKIKDANIVYDI